MSGKTVEEVAREIAIRFEPRDGMPDHPRTIWRHHLQDAIKSALRQREQETAETCAQIAALITTGDDRCVKAVERSAKYIASTIRARFPKDET